MAGGSGSSALPLAGRRAGARDCATVPTCGARPLAVTAHTSRETPAEADVTKYHPPPTLTFRALADAVRAAANPSAPRRVERRLGRQQFSTHARALTCELRFDEGPVLSGL